jgi:hypothetical protein
MLACIPDVEVTGSIPVRSTSTIFIIMGYYMKRTENENDKPQFDVDIAITDGGVCGRQQVRCADCQVGMVIGYNPKVGQLCHHNLVLGVSKQLKVKSLGLAEMIDYEILGKIYQVAGIDKHQKVNMEIDNGRT